MTCIMEENEIEIKDVNVLPINIAYGDKISTIDKEVSYNEFFNNYLLCNQPCLIKEFATCHWECRRLWALDDKPNLSCLRDSFGDSEVPVAICNEREFNSQKKVSFTLCEYLDYLEGQMNSGHPPSKPNLYLKDWHFTRDFPNADIYQVPKYFACDWLNEYFSSRTDLQDDYRFVYIGPKGSWTPLHSDVFTSFSWSVNVVGRKRWVLFPPGEEVHLRDRFGNLAYDISSKDTLDKLNFPSYDKPGKFYDVTQEAGEAIFVPSGWHHQVWNIEDTISVNHNWVNGCNIQHMWSALRSSLSDVQREVSDCRDMDDWHSHCQLMLRATHGLNFEEFFNLLQCVAEPRIRQVMGNETVHTYGGWKLGLRHAIWDLKQISATLCLFLNDPNLSNLSWVEERNPNKLKIHIDDLLKNVDL